MIIRPTYLEKLDKLRDKQIIKVLTGVRRCGKSTILEMYQNHLLENGISKQQIQNYNFEDLELSKLTNYQELHSHILEKIVPDKMNYIFLDEIQNVHHFEKTLDSLLTRKNIDLYITGSNAFILSGELATLLSGRSIEIKVYPLSFKEYYASVNLDKQTAFQNFLDRGGFPFAVEINDEETYRNYIEGIVNTVLIKDILSRTDRGNAKLLEAIARFMTDTSGNLITPTKIANTLTSNNMKTTTSTVNNYLESLGKAYLFYRCDRYDLAGKKYLQINPKYYPVDQSLRRALLGNKRPNMGSRLEAAVYMELKERGYEVYVGRIGDLEVDFVAIKDGVKSYYQVCLSLNDDKTYQREIKSLKAINDNYSKIILTEDLGNYDDNGIQQRNVIDWMLDK